MLCPASSAPCQLLQLYNFFLEQGVLVEGAAGAKGLASLLPAMAFYLGASQMSQYASQPRARSLSNSILIACV